MAPMCKKHRISAGFLECLLKLPVYITFLLVLSVIWDTIHCITRYQCIGAVFIICEDPYLSDLS